MTSTRRFAAATLLGGLAEDGHARRRRPRHRDGRAARVARVRRQDDGRADAADGGVDREPRRRHLRRRARRSTSSVVRSAERGGEGVRREDQGAAHSSTREAFNAAATRLGGKAQDQPDPVLLGVVNNAKPSLTGPAQVVDLAIQLEDGAAQTYVANTGAYSNKNARAVAASIMGVEAQHVAILNAVKALRRRGRRRPDRAAARRRQAARRRRQRRLPGRVLPDDGCPSRERRSSAVRRRNRKQEPIAISERELVAMTHDLDDAHHESLPSMRDSLAEWSESDDDIRSGITRLVSTPASRRAFLFGGGAVLGGFALAGSGMRQRPRRRRDPERALGVAAAPRRRRSSAATSRWWRSRRRSRTSPSAPTRPASTRPRKGSARRGTAGGGDVRHDRAEPAQGPRRGVERRAHRRGQEGDHAASTSTVKKSVDKAFAERQGRARAGQARARSRERRRGHVPRRDRRREGPRPASRPRRPSSRWSCNTRRSCTSCSGEYPVPDSFTKKTGARPVERQDRVVPRLRPARGRLGRLPGPVRSVSVVTATDRV